jgi:GNAT superfamily N-acetyltransferase
MTLIRSLNSSDFEIWLPLWHGYLEFYEVQISDEVTKSTFDRMIDPNSSIHGALASSEGGVALGLVNWVMHPGTWSISDTCYLEDLFVSSEHRGQGIGQALIEHVYEWAKSQSAAKVYWLTAESNKNAQQLYDRIATKTGFIQYQMAIED